MLDFPLRLFGFWPLLSTAIMPKTTMMTRTLLIVFGMGFIPVCAAEQDEPNPLPEKVDRLLRKMSDHLAKAETFAFEAELLFDEVRVAALCGRTRLLREQTTGTPHHQHNQEQQRYPGPPVARAPTMTGRRSAMTTLAGLLVRRRWGTDSKRDAAA